MPMEEALTARLTAGPVGGIVDEAVDWFDRPKSLPALTLTKAEAGREWTHEGPDGLDEPRVRFECWGRTKAEAALLARAVLAEMEQPAVIQDTRFHEGTLELERWDQPESLSGGQPLFRVTMDFTFYHELA